MEANGVNPKTGKGKNCTRLTLYKHLKASTSGNRSEFMRVKDETRDPNSKKGLGRKAFVFVRRVSNKLKTTAKKSKVTVKVDSAKSSETYEAQKAAIMSPTTTPAPTPIAEIPASATVTTPVAETTTQQAAIAA